MYKRQYGGVRAACRAAAAAVLYGLLVGCRLVDQTSFGGEPRPPAPDALAAALASHGAAPLLVVRPDDGVPYTEALRLVVQAAQARDGEARFRLETVVPAGADLQAQQAALEGNGAAARQMLDDLGLVGVAPDRVTLTARTDPTLMRPELRLYRS